VGKSRSEFAAWSPDGKTLAIDNVDDGTVRLVDGESGRPLNSLQPPKPTRDNVFAWSPNGKALAVGGQDRLVHIWDPDTGKVLHELAGHSARIIFVAWSPDGRLLASGAQDNTARLWEADSGKPLHVLSGHGDKGISLLAFSPDAKILASADEERHLVYLWDVASGERLGVCEGFAAPVRALAWSPDGKTLVAYGADKTLRFWDDTGLFLRKVEAGPPTVLLYGAAVSPNRETLACCWLTSVWLYETATGRRSGVWLALPESRYLTVGPDGHYGGSVRIERQLVYVVQTEQGQETLSPEEFTKRYGWKNDPEKVHLVVK
jgi:WD40 repeat protein